MRKGKFTIDDESNASSLCGIPKKKKKKERQSQVHIRNSMMLCSLSLCKSSKIKLSKGTASPTRFAECNFERQLEY